MRDFTIRAVILLGVVLGTLVAGPSASAEGPATRLSGYVIAPDSPLPTRVRALGAGDTVCGTASVVRIDSAGTVGSYSLQVTAGTDRAGCPLEGDTVRFVLLTTNVGDGTPVKPVGDARFRGGAEATVHLFAVPETSAAGWSGALPAPGRTAALTWTGPSDVAIEDALGALDFEVASAWHLPEGSRRWLSYTPGVTSIPQTLTTLTTGDLVHIRAR